MPHKHLYSKGKFELIEMEVPGLSYKPIVFNRGNAVSCLLVDEGREVFILTSQLRPATLLNNNSSGMVIETMAGMIESGDSDTQTVQREALEELGYRIKSVEEIGKFFSSPGACSEQISLFVAYVTKKDQVSTGGGLEEESENITTVEITFEKAKQMLEDMAFNDLKTFAAISFFFINRGT